MAEAWYLKKLRELERANKELLNKLAEEKKKRENTEEENKDLKRQLHEMAMAKEAKRPKFSDYSLRKQEKKLGIMECKKSTGRIPFEKKLKEVEFEKDVYPEGVKRQDCDSPARWAQRGLALSYLSQEMGNCSWKTAGGFGEKRVRD